MIRASRAGAMASSSFPHDAMVEVGSSTSMRWAAVR